MGMDCPQTRRRWARIGAAVLFALIAPLGADALDGSKAVTQHHYQVWLTEDGLPQISVQDVLQTRDGYLWLGTQEGLVRYDGARFVVFDNRNTGSIENNYFNTLVEGSDGALWAGTYGGGVLRYQQGVFTPFTEVEGLSSDIVHALADAGNGDVWVGTERGLSRYHDGVFDVFGAAEGLPHELVQSLMVDREGTLWVGTRGGGITCWENGRFASPDLGGTLASELISTLYQDRDAAIWIGTQDAGLYRLADGELHHFGAAEGLSSEIIVTIDQDRDGCLWVGTYDGGICRHDGDLFDCLTPAEGLEHQHITSIHEDTEGNLWFGSLGGGLNRLRDAKFTSYTTTEGLSTAGVWVILEGQRGLWVGTESGLDLLVDGEFVAFEGQAAAAEDALMAIHEDEDGTVWTGLYGGGLRRLRDGRWTTFTTPSGLADDQVFSIIRDDQGALWVGTRSGLNRLADGQFTTFTTADGLPNDNIRVLHIDRKGVMWIGTRGGGIARYQYGTFAPFEPDTPLEPNQKMVYAIHEDANGTLWFGTLGGLIRYADGATQVFNVEDGLFDGTAYAILEDDGGHLWMSCNRGVFRVAKQDLIDYVDGTLDRIPSDSFGHGDGMPDSECNGGSHPAAYRTADGRLWFPTVDGLASVDPRDMQRNEVVPPVQIESVEIDGQSADPEMYVELPPGRKRVVFRFAALSLTAGEQVRFKYMLEGVDDTWSAETDRREAVYSSIPHKSYRFRVVACNNDGIWNEEGDVYTFRVRPYLYQSPWFATLCASLVLLSFAIGHGIRVRRLTRRTEELESAVDERTHELRKMADELKELSLRDPLTGLRNRRFLFETLASLMEDLARRQAHVSAGATDRRGRTEGDVVGLFMVDIDHFKEVNDTHGHDAGDQILRRFAELLQECVRAEDIVVRWGGGEFLVVLPHTLYGSLSEFAERLRVKVESEDFQLPSGGVANKTCSVGYSSLPFADDPDGEISLEQAITVADLGLYKAKRDGRNRTVHVVAGDQLPKDADDLALMLSDLDWALRRGYLQTVD